ncbi:MAG: hypothetical protein HQL08_13055 [Nitrospirae bacterium]|nr:hypothetical protein [Nitrospirota bacterium]
MTTLNKTIKRETKSNYRGRHIIIQLEPCGIIRVKEKGLRTWYETSIEAVFSMAGKAYAEKIRQERKLNRKNKKLS